MMNHDLLKKNDAPVLPRSPKISWSSIVVGALISVGLGFIFELFVKGMGLSLFTIDVTSGATTLLIGGFIVIILGSIATMFLAGFAAGFFAKSPERRENYGMTHGFTAWCLGLILMAIFSVNISTYISNYANIFQNHSPTAMNTTPPQNNLLNPQTNQTMRETHEEVVQTVGALHLSMFSILMIGALSASIGGHCGSSYRNKKEIKNG